MTLEDIALGLTPGIGAKGTAHLLGVFGDAERVFAASEPELIQQAGLRGDLAREIVRRTAFADAERELKYCVRHGIRGVASTDGEYPALLREIPDYPHVIYVLGDVEALSMRCVSMVGTRRNTSYGVRMCDELVRGLVERVPELCIVSGLAFGIDAACHHAALRAGAKTVAVLPCALPDVTPVQHAGLAREIVEKGGVLITELHSQSKQRGQYYSARNRIIAGISAGTVVVEAPCKSGALDTARLANEYDRSVLAVPGRAGDGVSFGTNCLIRDHKAQLILSAEDITRELQWELRMPDAGVRTRPVEIELTADETRIMACFVGSDPVSVEELEMRCDLGTVELLALMGGLEILGAVRRVAGNRYMKLV